MKSTPLYPYQIRVDEFTKDKPQIGMFVFYGGGKTYMSLKWLEQLYEMGKPIFPVLILTTGSLIAQWGFEIEKHCSRRYALITGNAEDRIKALSVYAEIYVLNYDAIRSPTLLRFLSQLHFSTVIADESPMLKEARTFRFKTWRKLLKNTPFRALLAGKPILERSSDVWAQMLFLDHGQTLGKNFWRFRNKYFDPGPPWDPHNWELKIGAGEEIAVLLNNKCIQIRKTEIEDQLPPKIYVPVYFEMPIATRRVYKELKENFAATLADGEQIDTKWAMVKASKMHQLCQGFMYLQAWAKDYRYKIDAHAARGSANYTCTQPHISSKVNAPPNPEYWEKIGANWKDVDQTKLNWLKENLPLMLSNGPTLLWVCFKTMQYRVAKLLGEMGLPFGCFRSKLSQKDRSLVIDGFNRREYDVLLLSQQTAAAGLNLQRANQAVFICTDFRAALRENAEERCHRLGSEIHKSVTYYDLITKRSVDGVVLDAIQNKKSVAEEILAYIQRGD